MTFPVIPTLSWVIVKNKMRSIMPPIRLEFSVEIIDGGPGSTSLAVWKLRDSKEHTEKGSGHHVRHGIRDRRYQNKMLHSSEICKFSSKNIAISHGQRD